MYIRSVTTTRLIELNVQTEHLWQVPVSILSTPKYSSERSWDIRAPDEVRHVVAHFQDMSSEFCAASSKTSLTPAPALPPPLYREDQQLQFPGILSPAGSSSVVGTRSRSPASPTKKRKQRDSSKTLTKRPVPTSRPAKVVTGNADSSKMSLLPYFHAPPASKQNLQPSAVCEAFTPALLEVCMALIS